MSNIFDENKINKYLTDLLVDKSPVGIIIIDKSGFIRFVNPAIGTILGSTGTVGLNILEFSTVRNSEMYDGIHKALKGEFIEIKNLFYISYTNHAEKYLDIKISPFHDQATGAIDYVILLISDMTEENKLRIQIQNTYLSGLEALASLVDARDAYTGKHSQNVSRYAAMICENITCDASRDKERVRIAASFHDIGKVGIPDSILKKNGKLTLEEYEIMKTHPAIGAAVIDKIDGFNDISRIIRHHHERWDGKGYPDGLQGNQIPFGSQIISIADTFDAIVSDRVYRKSLGKEMATQILIEEKGRQFNPDLVDIFLKNLKLIQ